MNNLERYYEKFDEDKRLKRRHGEVEFFVTNFYIHEFLKRMDNPKIADIGAGTGAYSIELAKEGYDITAVEYVKKNLQVLRSKQCNVKTFLGNAKNLSMFDDSKFDITLVFGPMYHAKDINEKLQILKEAKRITKPNGYIFVAYYMNEYAMLTHGFKDNYICEEIRNQRVDKNFKVVFKEGDIFSFDRIKDINFYNKQVKLKRKLIFAPDGASDYMRDTLNKMDFKTFELFKKYQLSVSKDKNLLGASSHLVDVLINTKE